MKKLLTTGAVLFTMALALSGEKVNAASGNTILNGVTIGGVDVSGMTAQEATTAIEQYVSSVQNAGITLQGRTPEQNITMTAGELGLMWTNPEVVEEAIGLGKEGNVVQRYKYIKDAANKGVQLDMKYALDDTILTEVLEEEAQQFNQDAVDYQLKRENGQFVITDGQVGYVIDETASLQTIQEYIANEWNLSDCSIALDIEEEEPRGSEAELSQVKDVLGTYTTNFSTSGASRSANVENGTRLASGKTLYPGEEFSVLGNITPFTEANGYYPAGSYLNGLVVESIGGGICQVSTTLYNAVLLSELQVTERFNHSMIISYVDPSMDAAIAESGGKDFKFVNSTDYPIYIDGYTSGKNITFTIYGVETRASNRKVRYESETLSTTDPGADSFVLDSSQPIGYTHTQSAHMGIKAQLWKIVTVDGVEESREVVNSSNYKAVPRIVTVGTGGADEAGIAQLNAAVATGDLGTVKSTAADLAAYYSAAAQIQADEAAAAQAQAEAIAEGTVDAGSTDPVSDQ